MNRTCKQCAAAFEITQDDLGFYEKVSPVFNGKKELIPPPTLCPECCSQQRFTWRNERSLYHRSCALCEKPVISIYHEDSTPPVYCLDCWWGDRWNAITYGISPTPTISFMQQFSLLSTAVPRPILQVLNGQNSDYTNFSRDGKDCYLCFSIVHCEHCLYVTHTDESQDCTDCEGDERCELCYECNNCIGCYALTHSARCENCSDSSFLYDCNDCQHCFLSSNLRNKQYVFKNKQLTPQEFEQQIRTVALNTTTGTERAQNLYKNVLRSAIHHPFITHCESCTGDVLNNCKNCRECFDCSSGEDSVRCYRSPPTFRDCRESYGVYGGSELCMEICNGKNVHRTIVAIQCQNTDECLYCLHCHSSKKLFGCIGLRNKQFCILNKQYTKEEYEALVPQAIAKMREDGEWGEFFPVSMSPFAYNETCAQEYFQLTKEEVIEQGWKWRDQTDEMPRVDRVISAMQLPDSIDDIPDDILNWAIECDATKRPFKIIKQELDFYRKMRLPIPHLHPDERYRRRMLLKNPRKLWKRNCSKCQKVIETTYAPDRPEIVYCEECYLKEVY